MKEFQSCRHNECGWKRECYKWPCIPVVAKKTSSHRIASDIIFILLWCLRETYTISKRRFYEHFLSGGTDSVPVCYLNYLTEKSRTYFAFRTVVVGKRFGRCFRI